jgi:porin
MKITETTINVRLSILFIMLTAAAASALAQAPTPDNSGNILKWSTMTGNWGGLRTDMAKKGMTFDFYLTQTEIGVVSGGIDTGLEYGGRGDFYINLDTGKAGLWPGGYLMIEGEVNYGNGANQNTGALLPVNTNQVFPVPGKPGSFAIPAVTFTQFLSPYFGVTAGKFNVTAADDNEFAHGKYAKGDTQFMNTAFNFIPSALFGSPYTPVGAGLVILPNKNPAAAIIKAVVYSSSGTASQAGFDKFDHDDLSVYLEGRVQTHCFGKTGHQDVMYLQSNKDITSIDQRLTLDPETQVLATKSGTWMFSYNFDQYLWEPQKGKGFGLFGRFAVSDGNPNFLHYFYELGFGGKGVGSKRPNDEYGFGGYYINISNPTLTTPTGTRHFLRDEKGFEAYYSFALTPWAHLSPDLQVVHGAFPQNTVAHIEQGVPLRNIKTAVVLGLRLNLAF